MRQLNNFGGFITSLLVLLLLESCSCNNQYLVPDFEKDINHKNILEGLARESQPNCNTDETAEQASATQRQQEADTQEEDDATQEEEEDTQEAHHQEANNQTTGGISSDNPDLAGSHATNGPAQARNSRMRVSQEIMDLLYNLTQSRNPVIQNFVNNLNQELAITKATNEEFPFANLAALRDNSASNDNIANTLVASPQYMQGILNELINNANTLPAGINSFVQVDELTKAIKAIQGKLAALPLADDDR